MPSSSANILVGVAAVSWFPITAETGVGPPVAIQYGAEVALGWTSDGAVLTVSTDIADIVVENLDGPIKRVVTIQGVSVTLNMAEGTLVNLGVAIPKSAIDPAGTLTLGVPDTAAFPYEMGKVVLIGKGPSAVTRTVTLFKVTPTGEVGIPYKKGEISVVPVTFQALKDGIPANTATYDKFGTIVDA